jgi:hypothetical protein
MSQVVYAFLEVFASNSDALILQIDRHAENHAAKITIVNKNISDALPDQSGAKHYE